MLVSAGWDSTIRVWDRRQRMAAGFMYGAYVCGDALDIRGDEVLSGSWRDDVPLQQWDLRTLKLMTNVTSLKASAERVRAASWLALPVVGHSPSQPPSACHLSRCLQGSGKDGKIRLYAAKYGRRERESGRLIAVGGTEEIPAVHVMVRRGSGTQRVSCGRLAGCTSRARVGAQVSELNSAYVCRGGMGLQCAQSR